MTVRCARCHRVLKNPPARGGMGPSCAAAMLGKVQAPRIGRTSRSAAKRQAVQDDTLDLFAESEAA